MATKQTGLNPAIAQAVVKAAIQVMTMAEAERSQIAGPKHGGPIMKQPAFDWKCTDKYAELRNFRLETKNMFQNYRISQAE